MIPHTTWLLFSDYSFILCVLEVSLSSIFPTKCYRQNERIDHGIISRFKTKQWFSLRLKLLALATRLSLQVRANIFCWNKSRCCEAVISPQKQNFGTVAGRTRLSRHELKQTSLKKVYTMSRCASFRVLASLGCLTGWRDPYPGLITLHIIYFI